MLVLGVGGAWLLGVLSLMAVRLLAASGSIGARYGFLVAFGWWLYERGDRTGIVNMTLNTVHNGILKFDTIVSDRKLENVWQNQYVVQMLRAARKRTTVEYPLVTFDEEEDIEGLFKRIVSTVTVVENGQRKRVVVRRADDYRAVYGPLLGLCSEKLTNAGALLLSIKAPMVEHKIVAALTYEKLTNTRARHFRVMLVQEAELLALPDECPALWHPDHATRYKTLCFLRDEYKRNPQFFGVLYSWTPIT